jgi:hypothetical protein
VLQRAIVQRDEKLVPVAVGLLGLQAIVQVPNPLANLIEQAGGTAKKERRVSWKIYTCMKLQYIALQATA